MTQNTPLPAGLSYIHSEVGHCDHPHVASAPSGLFVLFMFTPGYWQDGALKLETAKQCLILKKVDRAGGVPHELRRWESAQSAAWLLAHGADPVKSQGKYGPAGLCVDGHDIVIIMNIRINGCQTLTEWREPGLAG